MQVDIATHKTKPGPKVGSRYGRRQSTKVPMCIRFDRSMVEDLHKRSEELGVSIAHYIRKTMGEELHSNKD